MERCVVVLFHGGTINTHPLGQGGMVNDIPAGEKIEDGLVLLELTVSKERLHTATDATADTSELLTDSLNERLLLVLRRHEGRQGLALHGGLKGLGVIGITHDTARKGYGEGEAVGVSLDGEFGQRDRCQRP
jgi:hypothetical protein